MFSAGTVLAEPATPADVVLNYYEASREGNITEMKALIAGSFYNRRKALLENNDSYPAFLMDHFHGSTTNIEESNIDNKNQIAIVTVSTHFSNQSIDTSRLILKIDGNGSWKIVDEKN